jgi:hypothetical protein
MTLRQAQDERNLFQDMPPLVLSQSQDARPEIVEGRRNEARR